MRGALAALVLFGSVTSLGDAHGADLRVRHYRVSGWRLDVQRDRFTGHVSCTIKKPNITYDHEVVTFRFRPNVDTANAVFRIDEGPLRRAGDVAVEAAGLGVGFSGPNLGNPSNGEVHIPVHYLSDARRVAIQPSAKKAHRVFDLAGLSHALDEAEARGCEAGQPAS